MKPTLAPSTAEILQWRQDLRANPNSGGGREYHLNYEIWMLEETCKKGHDDEVVKNALIESFCIHARNLFEFFSGEARLYTQSYQPFAHISKNSREGIVTKLNVHVAHVQFQGRVTNDADKINDRDRARILNILSDEIKQFKNYLRPEYSDVEIRDLPKVVGFFPCGFPQSSTTTSHVIVGDPIYSFCTPASQTVMNLSPVIFHNGWLGANCATSLMKREPSLCRPQIRGDWNNGAPRFWVCIHAVMKVNSASRDRCVGDHPTRDWCIPATSSVKSDQFHWLRIRCRT